MIQLNSLVPSSIYYTGFCRHQIFCASMGDYYPPPLPPSQYIVVPSQANAMGGGGGNNGAGQATDQTVDGEWDPAGLCGCCSGGRGFSGFGHVCYTCWCMPCAQSSVAGMLRKLKGRDVWDNRSMVAVNNGFRAAKTKSSLDNGASISLLANDMQDHFEHDKQLDQCTVTTLSFACPVLFITWMWHTASNLEKRAEMVKKAGL